MNENDRKKRKERDNRGRLNVRNHKLIIEIFEFQAELLPNENGREEKKRTRKESEFLNWRGLLQ